MNPTLSRIVVTYLLSPPPEAPDDCDCIEIDSHYDDLRSAIVVLGGVGAPAVVPKLKHDGYGRWQTVSATIRADFYSTPDAIIQPRRVPVASVSKDGWEPERLNDETLLDVLGDFGRAIRVGVAMMHDAGPLARLYLHSASSNGRSPATCDDCAADDRCLYEATATILGGFGR